MPHILMLALSFVCMFTGAAGCTWFDEVVIHKNRWRPSMLVTNFLLALCLLTLSQVFPHPTPVGILFVIIMSALITTAIINLLPLKGGKS